MTPTGPPIELGPRLSRAPSPLKSLIELSLGSSVTPSWQEPWPSGVPDWTELQADKSPRSSWAPRSSRALGQLKSLARSNLGLSWVAGAGEPPVGHGGQRVDKDCHPQRNVYGLPDFDAITENPDNHDLEVWCHHLRRICGSSQEGILCRRVLCQIFRLCRGVLC